MPRASTRAHRPSPTEASRTLSCAIRLLLLLLLPSDLACLEDAVEELEHPVGDDLGERGSAVGRRPRRVAEPAVVAQFGDVGDEAVDLVRAAHRIHLDGTGGPGRLAGPLGLH